MIEKKEFLLNLYAWDNICADNNAKLYVFNFRSRGVGPKTDYFGKMKATQKEQKKVLKTICKVKYTSKGLFFRR